MNSSDFSDSFSSCEEVVILDFETTGLTPPYDRIIEVAAVKVRENRIIDTFTSLTNPGRPIPSFITTFTGISNSMVKNAPAPEIIMPELHQFIGNKIVVAHNASFDKRFLSSEMERANLKMPNPFLCTLLLSRRLIFEVTNYKLSTLAQHLNIEAVQAHRALSDVHVTAQLWNHLYQTVAQKSGLVGPPTKVLVDLCRQSKSSVTKFFCTLNKIH